MRKRWTTLVLVGEARGSRFSIIARQLSSWRPIHESRADRAVTAHRLVTCKSLAKHQSAAYEMAARMTSGVVSLNSRISCAQFVCRTYISSHSCFNSHFLARRCLVACFCSCWHLLGLMHIPVIVSKISPCSLRFRRICTEVSRIFTVFIAFSLNRHWQS